MKQKIIKTDKSTVLVVELPNSTNVRFDKGYVKYFNKDINKECLLQPYRDSTWQLLGRIPDIMEGQFEKIVDFGDQEPGNDKYILKWKDYEVANVGEECPYMDYSLDTATESFYSLLQANEVYFENPIPPFKVWDKERTFLFIKVD